MKDQKDKQIDQLFHKLIQEHGLEQPSVRFTDNVMDLWMNKATAIQYQPLIGKAGKFIIIGVVLIILILAFASGNSSSPAYLEYVSKFNIFSGMQFSTEFGIIFFICSMGVWILMAFDKLLKNLMLK
jgi:hypothetical protein